MNGREMLFQEEQKWQNTEKTFVCITFPPGNVKREEKHSISIIARGVINMCQGQRYVISTEKSKSYRKSENQKNIRQERRNHVQPFLFTEFKAQFMRCWRKYEISRRKI